MRMSEKAAKRMQAQQVAHDCIEVWPENWQAVGFFMQFCRTQWRVGMNGPSGLDYTAVLACIDRHKLEPEKASELFEDVQVMEAAALEVMASK